MFRRARRRRRKVYGEKGIFKGNAVNEEGSGRDRTTPAENVKTAVLQGVGVHY